MAIKIGVLGLQGDFREHLQILDRLGIEGRDVRTREALKEVDGLILPGGESTTMVHLLEISGLFDALAERGHQGFPFYGTCAGMILLAKHVSPYPKRSLALIDIDVARNAYGRQIESFEADLEVKSIGKVHAVFIRAPQVTRVGRGAEVLAVHEKLPVIVRQANVLVSSFHPELTGETRLHRYFAQMVQEATP
jgi:5'-phosphate synthase pdxT subunit